MARKIWASCKRWLMLKNFKLRHDRPKDFVHSWLFPSPLPYAIFVTGVSVYTVIMGLVSGFLSDYGVKIFIWLTYWSFFTLTARFIVTAVNAWRYIVFTLRSHRAANKATSQCPEMPVLYKIQWLLQNMSNCSAVIVAGLYWIVLYSGQPDSFISINSHALNSVLVIVDVMVSRAPVRVQHLVYTFLFMLVFTIFTVVYWAAGGTNHKGQHYVYSTLDYTHKPWLAVAMIAGVLLIAVPLVQLIVYGFFRLRVCIGRLSSSSAAGTTQKNSNGENGCGSGHTGGELDRRCSNVMYNKDREAGGGAVVVVEKTYLTARLTSRCAEEEEEIDDVEMDFEMDVVPRPPMLRNETAQISCTDSTNALLGSQDSN